MDNDTRMKTFNAIASQMFTLPEEGIHDALTSHDIPAWDSMNYVFFIAELEKEFGISFSMDEVMNVSCLGDLRAIVEKRVKK